MFCKSDTRRIDVEWCERKGATISMLNFFPVFHCFSISFSAILVKIIAFFSRFGWICSTRLFHSWSAARGSSGYITTWANEVYYVSSDFNAFLVRIELYSVFTSSDSYRDFYNCLKLSDFFQICTVNQLDLNNLLHALLIFYPRDSTPKLPSTRHDLTHSPQISALGNQLYFPIMKFMKFAL